MATTENRVQILEGSESRWNEGSISNFSGGLNTREVGPSLQFSEFSVLDNWLVTNEGNLKVRPSIDLWSNKVLNSTYYEPFPSYSEGYEVNDTAILGQREPVSMVEDIESLWVATRGSTQTWITKYGKYDIYDTIAESFTHTLTDYAGRIELVKFGLGSISDIIMAIDGNARRFSAQDYSGTAIEDDDIEVLGLTAPVYSSNYQEYSINPRTGSTGSAANQQGITKTGTYYYKMSFVYDSTNSTKNGESNLQSMPYTVQVDVNDDTPKKVLFSRIPTLPDEDNITKINIYRSPPDHGEGPYKLVGFIDTTDSSVIDYEDNVDYLEEGIEAPIGDNTPPQLKHPVVAGGRLWAFDAEIPNKLVWSNVGQPDVFESTSYGYLDRPGTGIAEFRGNLYIFDTDGVYSTDSYNPNIISKISSNGCVSHHSIVNTGLGLTWLGKDNVFWANFATYYQDGDFPIPIADNIKNNFDSMTVSRKSLAKAAYHDGYYFLSLNVGGKETTTRTYVYNVYTKSWSTIDKGVISFGTYNGSLILGIRDVLNDSGTSVTCHWLGIYNTKDVSDNGIDIVIVGEDKHIDQTSTSIATSLKTRPVMIGVSFIDTIISSAGMDLYADTEAITIDMEAGSNSRSISFDSTDLSASWTDTTLFWAADDGPYNDNQYYPDGETYFTTWASRTSEFVNIHKRLNKLLSGKSFSYAATSSDCGRSEIYKIHFMFRQKEPVA